ncbi:MAG: uncharacterized protein KVP18_002218 [Porospora cf. gigantea A]|uniref:uncharacterized protein n=1 Tax=Porospora cf. gigantea A TaxID=2853593 RepID=UPI0035595D0A|nr:MAG: hypothetical protein KVP18_002218 [Porospora cf. gigantea A]
MYPASDDLSARINGPWPGFVQHFDDNLVIGSAKPASWILCWSHFDEREGHRVRVSAPETADCLARLMVPDIDSPTSDSPNRDEVRREEFYLRVAINGHAYFGVSFVQRTRSLTGRGLVQEAIGVFGPETDASSSCHSVLKLVLTSLYVSTADTLEVPSDSERLLRLSDVAVENCQQVFDEVLDSLKSRDRSCFEVRRSTGNRISVMRSEPDFSLFSCWRPVVERIHVLWEAILQGASVVVVSSDASRSSKAVLSLKHLLLPFLSLSDLDYSPLITTFHPQFHAVLEHLQSSFHATQKIIGGVNPLLYNAKCPNILLVSLDTKRSPSKGMDVIFSTEKEGLQSWLAGSFSSVLAFPQSYVGNLVLTGSQEALESVNDTTLRRYFLETNTTFLRPLLQALDRRLEAILSDLEANPFRLLRRDMAKTWLPIQQFLDSVEEGRSPCDVDFDVPLWRGLKPKGVAAFYSNFLKRPVGQQWLQKEERSRKETAQLHRLNCLLKVSPDRQFPPLQQALEVLMEVEECDSGTITDSERAKLAQLHLQIKATTPEHKDM